MLDRGTIFTKDKPQENKSLKQKIFVFDFAVNLSANKI